MTFRCDDCGTACFCDADPEAPDTWPLCASCHRDMLHDSEART